MLNLGGASPPDARRALPAAGRAGAARVGLDASERILVLAPTGRDGAMVADALHKAGFEALPCAGIPQLCHHLEEGAGAAFIAEEALASVEMDRLQETLGRQPAWSDLPIIIMTGGGKTTQFSQRLARRLGGIGSLTLLERPLRILTLVSAVQAALRARRKQYQVRALLAEKEQAVRQRDRFLAMLGHELRNPLAAVRAAVEVLDQAGAADPRVLPEHCRIIKRQASHLARLVDDLLDVARATAGKMMLNWQAVDLREVAQRSVEGIKLALGTQQHEIIIDPSATSAIVSGDPVRLEQVITNLLSNSVKYTPTGGTISITVGPEDNSVVLRVRDTGEGIPAEMLPRIFEPFVQVQQNLDRSRGGLGLGLPLVKALVEMHKGSIHAASGGVGQGSEFIIRLPLLSPAGAPGPREEAPLASEQTTRRVLLIEDNPDSRAAMRALIRLWGHQVVVAEDGPSGVQRAHEFRPDVALVDIGLPGLDGYGVAQRVRQDLGTSVYLVALTGYGQPEDRQRTREAGFDEHLVKPVEPDRLAQLLAGPVPRADR
jgi:signal transduction histidine kinase/CheY-like chemotaxis protein